MAKLGAPDILQGISSYPQRMWATYRCTNCGQCVLAATVPLPVSDGNLWTEFVYPGVRQAANEIPEAARNFLQQAFDTLHAPDAAAVMAGSAVDAMLRVRGYEKGSLYDRIDQAVGDHLLTKKMGEWAHWVRLGSNRPRHADKDKPNVSFGEARQSVEFAEALGQFLFVLSSRIEKGIADAAKATYCRCVGDISFCLMTLCRNHSEKISRSL